jgi:hypothetical protein
MTTIHPSRRQTAAWFAAAVLLAFSIVPCTRTQEPPPGVLVGPTLSASLRNAYAATREQAGVVARAANTWSRRAGARNYPMDVFLADLHTTQLQFGALRERFNWMGSLALQLNRSRTHNLVVELDAGLNIIAELLFFVEQQFNAGSLDAATLVRACNAFEETIREWQRELTRNSTSLSW